MDVSVLRSRSLSPDTKRQLSKYQKEKESGEDVSKIGVTEVVRAVRRPTVDIEKESAFLRIEESIEKVVYYAEEDNDQIQAFIERKLRREGVVSTSSERRLEDIICAEEGYFKYQFGQLSKERTRPVTQLYILGHNTEDVMTVENCLKSVLAVGSVDLKKITIISCFFAGKMSAKMSQKRSQEVLVESDLYKLAQTLSECGINPEIKSYTRVIAIETKGEGRGKKIQETEARSRMSDVKFGRCRVKGKCTEIMEIGKKPPLIPGESISRKAKESLERLRQLSKNKRIELLNIIGKGDQKEGFIEFSRQSEEIQQEYIEQYKRLRTALYLNGLKTENMSDILYLIVTEKRDPTFQLELIQFYLGKNKGLIEFALKQPEKCFKESLLIRAGIGILSPIQEENIEEILKYNLHNKELDECLLRVLDEGIDRKIEVWTCVLSLIKNELEYGVCILEETDFYHKLEEKLLGLDEPELERVFLRIVTLKKEELWTETKPFWEENLEEKVACLVFGEAVLVRS